MGGKHESEKKILNCWNNFALSVLSIQFQCSFYGRSSGRYSI